MKNIRQNVFETNSSSSHSFNFSIEYSDEFTTFDTLTPNTDGSIIFNGGDYSSAEFLFSETSDKANMVAVYCLLFGENELLNMFEKVVMEHTGADKIIYNIILQGKKINSYLSADSAEHLKSYLKTEKDIKDFIFNAESFFEAQFSYDG